MARRRILLSQNFLHDPVAVRRVVRAARLRPDDLVVEPGAGEGVLTRALAPLCRDVVAYEIDPRLAGALPRRVRMCPNVRTVQGDFVRSRPPAEPFAVVGNIPYARTADIVRWCLEAPRLTSATLLTQLEYARKRTGGWGRAPHAQGGGGGRWTLLTVRTWPEHRWQLVARVGRESFTPAPRTDSAVLRIDRRPVPLLPRELLPAYDEFVAYGFTGVGGSLAATLARRYRARRVRAVFGALGLDTSLPVGLVTPGQWLELFRRLHPDRTTP